MGTSADIPGTMVQFSRAPLPDISFSVRGLRGRREGGAGVTDEILFRAHLDYANESGNRHYRAWVRRAWSYRNHFPEHPSVRDLAWLRKDPEVMNAYFNANGDYDADYWDWLDSWDTAKGTPE